MSDTSDLREPQQYNFENWDFFCSDAVRYHLDTHPEDLLVSDYIETFRKFMSADVVRHLGPFMTPHPRYDTTAGRDAWLGDLRRAVSKHDKSAKLPRTVSECQSRFKERKTQLRSFWRELDRLVLLGTISSLEQRQYFWETLSWSTQESLVERHPQFDPYHELWESEDIDSIKEAEQSLARFLDTADSDILNPSLLKFTGFVAICFALTVAILWPAVIFYRASYNPISLGFSCFFLFLGGLAALFTVGSVLTCISLSRAELKSRAISRKQIA